MPLYESRKHAENRISVKAEWRDALVIGPSDVVASVIQLIVERGNNSRPLRIAFDGWYNIDWPAVLAELEKQAGTAGLRVDTRSAVSL